MVELRIELTFLDSSAQPSMSNVEALLGPEPLAVSLDTLANTRIRTIRSACSLLCQVDSFPRL